MSRPLLASALALTLLFAAALGLIRAQPYDDADLRTFFSPPDGCDMPCFLGIRPGETTVEEAMALLRGHAWVRDVSVYQGAGPMMLRWQWTGAQPALIDALAPGHAIIADRVIKSVDYRTTVPLGRLLLFYGQPDWGYVAPITRVRQYGLVYLPQQTVAQFELDAPYDMQRAFLRAVRVNLLGYTPVRGTDASYNPRLKTLLYFVM